MKLLSFFKLLFILILLVNCDSQTSVVPENTSIPTMKNNVTNIVYLFFEIEKNETGTEQIKHTDTKTTNGILKSGSIDNKENIPGNIAVTFLGIDGNTIAERIIEDPLNPMMETYSEEGINKEKIKLRKAEFSIRFNQTGIISSVQLEKIKENSKNHLLTIKL